MSVATLCNTNLCVAQAFELTSAADPTIKMDMCCARSILLPSMHSHCILWAPFLHSGQDSSGTSWIGTTQEHKDKRFEAHIVATPNKPYGLESSAGPTRHLVLCTHGLPTTGARILISLHKGIARCFDISLNVSFRGCNYVWFTLTHHVTFMD